MSFDHLCDWLTERLNTGVLPYGLERVAFRGGGTLTPDMIVVGHRGASDVWATVIRPGSGEDDDFDGRVAEDPLRWLAPASTAIFSLHHYLPDE